MKKVERSSELLWIFGIIFVALGVAICSKANLGVSMIAAPAFVVSEALTKYWSLLTVGVTEYVIQGIILMALCLTVRKFNWRYLLAFAVAVIYGYTLDLFLLLLSNVQFNTVWLRWIMLIIGDMITAFGVACFFRTYMPLQVFELFVAEVTEKFHLKISKTKWIFDLSLLILSITLDLTLFSDVDFFNWSTIGHTSFHSIGLGTLVTTVINSPLISLMGKLIDSIFDPSPRFAKLESFIKVK